MGGRLMNSPTAFCRTGSICHPPATAARRPANSFSPGFRRGPRDVKSVQNKRLRPEGGDRSTAGRLIQILITRKIHKEKKKSRPGSMTGCRALGITGMHCRLSGLRLPETVHGAGGDWSILGPIDVVCRRDLDRTHGPVPLPTRPRPSSGGRGSRGECVRAQVEPCPLSWQLLCQPL